MESSFPEFPFQKEAISARTDSRLRQGISRGWGDRRIRQRLRGWKGVVMMGLTLLLDKEESATVQ